MAQPSFPGAAVANPVAVISPHYCCPYPVDLSIVCNAMTITNGNFVVTNANGNVHFKVRDSFSDFIRQRRVLLDGAENPIVTLKEKLITAHNRWQVFRGESTEPQDLIFSAHTSSTFNVRTQFDVYLANNNTNGNVCDFKVQGSWLERSCTIYAGESSTVIAKMDMKYTVKSVLIGKDKLNVTIYPNIDYAFVVTLFVILNQINHERFDGDI